MRSAVAAIVEGRLGQIRNTAHAMPVGMSHVNIAAIVPPPVAHRMRLPATVTEVQTDGGITMPVLIV
jgi:hypothetical protein